MKTITITNAQYDALTALCGALSGVSEQVPTVSTKVDTPTMTNVVERPTVPVSKAAKREANKRDYRRINGFLAAATQASDANDAAKCAKAIANALRVATEKKWDHEILRVREAAASHGLAA